MAGEVLGNEGLDLVPAEALEIEDGLGCRPQSGVGLVRPMACRRCVLRFTSELACGRSPGSRPDRRSGSQPGLGALSNIYTGILICMGRNRATDDDRRRAAQLADFLARKRREARLSVQDLSTNSNVRYETIRALLAGKSVGPSFFLVADLAAALDVELDEIAREAR